MIVLALVSRSGDQPIAIDKLGVGHIGRFVPPRRAQQRDLNELTEHRHGGGGRPHGAQLVVIKNARALSPWSCSAPCL